MRSIFGKYLYVHLKFTVYGCKQASTYVNTLLQCCPASVGLAQACPNYIYHTENVTTVCIRILYSLDITPPLFISLPLLFAWICCWGIFISSLRLPQPLRLWRTRGRLELTVPPYVRSLATCWPPIHWPSDSPHGGRLVSSWWWCKNFIVFSDRSHSVPSLTISWSFALQNWATTSFIASRTRWWRAIPPLLFPLCAPQ